MSSRHGTTEDSCSDPSPTRVVQCHEVFWEGIEESLIAQIFRFKTHDPGS